MSGGEVVAGVGRGGAGSDHKVATEIDVKKQQMLWDLAQQCCADLNPGEIEMLYNLLITYADVMAYSTSDLGRTDKLRHCNDTGYEPPVQQQVHRISPHRSL